MGYLDSKENFTIDEILAHQSEIESDLRKIDKNVLDKTDDPELRERIQKIQNTDFDAVARHDVRTLLAQEGKELPNDSRFQKLRDAREAAGIRK